MPLLCAILRVVPPAPNDHCQQFFPRFLSWFRHPPLRLLCKISRAPPPALNDHCQQFFPRFLSWFCHPPVQLLCNFASISPCTERSLPTVFSPISVATRPRNCCVKFYEHPRCAERSLPTVFSPICAPSVQLLCAPPRTERSLPTLFSADFCCGFATRPCNCCVKFCERLPLH